MKEAHFSGWATKAGLRCTDGRVIMPGAFEHQDKQTVPLVWQHNHNDPENVLGHAILEHRREGVYAHAFFNDTPKAQHARQLVEHGDIRMLSIWANQLKELAHKVTHGAIREVSLVMSGANPGALIENVAIRHSDGDIDYLDDEVVIFTGLEFEHSAFADSDDSETDDDELASLGHADDDRTIADVYDSMTEEQQAVVQYMVGEAAKGGTAKHSDLDDTDTTDTTDDTDTTAGGTTTDQGGSDTSIDHSSTDTNDTTAGTGKEGKDMKKLAHHNAFENGGTTDAGGDTLVLSHDDMSAICEAAKLPGATLKTAVKGYALSHGIEDIDVLFPDAKSEDNVPAFLKRRTEWVDVVLNGVHKSPMGRIRTVWADITLPQARARGYVKGRMKKEEFFKVVKRITEPKTIYKKQKIDRDDIIDITDFDVVVWVKGEMRIMLDEEIARAILLGDGRDGDDEDKIDEEKIRPIAGDHELFTTTVQVQLNDTGSTMLEVSDAIVEHREELRGTGMPTMFTTQKYISKWMSLRDTTGRKIYESREALANEFQVAAVVPVEVMSEYPDLIAVIVNLVDYTLGADAGGQVSMFDDFDIDYNQYKYLIETRCCGALTKLKSAMVLKKAAADAVAVTPNDPTFNEDTGVITIVATTGVQYRDEDDNVLSAGPLTALEEGESMSIFAYATAGYFLETTDDENDMWTFVRPVMVD